MNITASAFPDACSGEAFNHLSRLARISHAAENPIKIIFLNLKWPGAIGAGNLSDPGLRHAVEKYNRAGGEHHGPEYYKDPKNLAPLKRSPFYAIRCYAGFLGTLGGIRIKHFMQVISKAGNPIPALYDAGQDAGGWEYRAYNLSMPGAAFGFAVNPGRMAGENAHVYIG